jgi:hypothetical protein
MTGFIGTLIISASISFFVLGFLFALVFGSAHDLAKSTKEKKWVRVRNIGVALWALSSLYVFYLIARGERPSYLNWLLEGI